jgi:3-hydroxyisobutyrate dehydrogenase
MISTNTGTATTTAAVIGTGLMGTGMVKSLLAAGIPTLVWNRTKSNADDACAAGATWVDSIADAAAAEVVLLSLADDSVVRNVLEEMPPRTLVIDLTTMAPHDSRSIAASYGATHYVTAPIFATPEAASRGEAFILSAGPAAESATLSPVWRALAKGRRHLGDDHGVAAGLKLLTNYLHLTSIAQLACAVETGRAWGLDDALITDWLGSNPAVTRSSRPRLEAILAGGSDEGYAQDHAVAALGYALRGADFAGTTLAGGREAQELYHRSFELGTEAKDVSAVGLAVRPRAQ